MAQRVLVPGDGLTLSYRATRDEDIFWRLGSLAAGDVVRRVRVFWAVDDIEATPRFGIVLGSSTGDNAAAFGAGRPLLTRSSNFVAAGGNKVPIIAMSAALSLRGWFEIPAGARVQAGAQHVIACIGEGANGGNVDWIVSVEVWRFLTLPDVVAGG